MWKWHSENDSREAWDDVVRSIDLGLIAAEKNNLILAFEPESENVVNSANRARKLLDELGNPRLRIVIDPANLISPGRSQKEILDDSFAQLGDAITIAHAKDRDSDFKACAVGKGVLDFEYYLRCLKQSEFTGPLILHGLEENEVAFSREFLQRSLVL
jgi:sugar phosphate isomerase/epimerase